MIPRFREWLKLPTLSDRAGLFLCRVITVLLGLYIIGVALMLASQESLSLFDAYLMISAVIGLPLGMPVLFGLWIKRLHWIGYYIIIIFAIIPSLYFVIQSSVNGENWPIQDRLLWIYGFSLIGCLISLPLWKWASKAYKEQVHDFYTKMHKPVDFENEIGASQDHIQFKVIGWTSLVLGALILLFLLIPNTVAARLQITVLSFL